jgi:glycosyltransferase involved in cell wall biosynthesis
MLDSGTTPMPRPSPDYDGRRPLRLVWSGVHIGRKGFPLLIHALAKLKDKNIEVSVLGAGPQTERWDTLAVQLGVIHMIRWMGKLPREAALAEMARSDALVFTSLMEAASHVTLEAISMGLPVICHDACGMSIAVDDRSGIKVPLVDVQTSIDGFAAAIAKLADNPAEVRRLTEGAARRATELTWDAKVEQIARRYERIAGHPHAAEPHEVLPIQDAELGPSASVPL